MKYIKEFFALPVLLVFSSCTTLSSEELLAEDYSFEICGHTVVKNVSDGSNTWSVFLNGNKLETLGAGYTLQDIKDAYCV